MKKAIFMYCILFLTNKIVAQIYVKDNSFIFNKGAMVFAKGNIELNGANSNFYLRNEGQFLQGAISTSANTGVGKLSVFQEGTVNNYAYNYWCSPVGNASSSVGNEDFGITMFTIPTTNTASTAATISSATYNGVSSDGALTIASYWIFKYLSQSTYSGWVHSAAATNISAGQGFTMKGTSGSDATNVGETAVNNPGSEQRYDFRGKPNDGDITINVADTKWTLTGNPYPSAIDLTAFLTASADCTGIAYFWEQDKTVNSHALLSYRGGYGAFSPISRGGMGIYVPATFYSYDISGVLLPLTSSSPNNSYARLFSPIGQGFMIEGKASGSTVTMKNLYRVFQKENSSNSIFEKNGIVSDTDNGHFLPPIMSVSGFDYTTVSTDEVPQIRFNTLLNNQAIKQIVLAFDDEATDGVDHAKDAKNPNNAPLDINFLLDDKDYIISVIQFDEDKRLPVSFKSTSDATFKITVADIINFDQANTIYLFDNETGLYHDIKNGEYEFSLPAGTFKDRFEITFKNTALSVSNPIKENIVVIQNNNSQLLTVSNPNLLDIKSVTLFDVSGKLLFNKVNLGVRSSYEFSTTTLSEGVYLAKIQSNDGQNIGQKIIVSYN